MGCVVSRSVAERWDMWGVCTRLPSRSSLLSTLVDQYQDASLEAIKLFSVYHVFSESLM